MNSIIDQIKKIAERYPISAKELIDTYNNYKSRHRVVLSPKEIELVVIRSLKNATDFHYELQRKENID